MSCSTDTQKNVVSMFHEKEEEQKKQLDII